MYSNRSPPTVSAGMEFSVHVNARYMGNRSLNRHKPLAQIFIDSRDRVRFRHKRTRLRRTQDPASGFSECYFPAVDLIARPILVLFDAFAPDLLLAFFTSSWQSCVSNCFRLEGACKSGSRMVAEAMFFE